MTKLLTILLASLAFALLPHVAIGQDIPIPPDCGEVKPWQPPNYQTGPDGQELGCLYDVLPEDRPGAGDGDILYSRGAYLLVDGPGAFTFLYLFIMPMPSGVEQETDLVVRADLSNFGSVSGPSACYGRGEVINHDEAEVQTFFLLPDGTGLQDVRYLVDLTMIVDPGQIFSVSFTARDKDMTDGVACEMSVFVDGILGAVGLMEVVTSVDGPSETPSDFTLGSAYPNPFTESTTLPFELSEPGEVDLAVYDILGREVARRDLGSLPAGSHSERWYAPAGLPAGAYLLRLTAGEATLMRRVSLLR